MADTKRFIPRPFVILAEELQEPVNLYDDEGMTIYGSVGEWLITEYDGSKIILTDALFRERYAPLDE